MANAGCINAYDCSGNLIRTLEQLQSSNIGVGVQYTAPNPLDDKRFDYIKYTDKCGCTCCLSGENEILIYATNGVIKNLTLTNDGVNEAIKIKWNEVFGSNRAKTIVRYKTGSYPVSITDGTLAVEETVKNQYSSTPFSLTGVLDETTYYFSVFAIDSNGTIINVQNGQIKTDFGRKPGVNTLAYFPLSSDASDHSGNGKTLTSTGTKVAIGYSFTETSMVSGGFSNCVFVSAWIKNVSFSGYYSTGIALENPVMGYYMYNTVYGNVFFLVHSSDSRIRVNGPSSPTNWHHICFGYDGTKSIYSIDGVVQTLYNGKGNIATNDAYLFRKDIGATANVNISEAIFESVCWTAQEITKYFNKTKSKYGL